MLANPKLITLEDAVRSRTALRESGHRLVVTNGCFDLLPAGHVHYLRQAAGFGDRLWILLNSDASVRALKGPDRPVQNEEHRAYVIAALEFVDAVIVFPNPRLDAELRALSPDVYVKAGDYTVETLDAGERAALEACGTDIRIVGFLEGFSATDLMRRIHAADLAAAKGQS